MNNGTVNVASADGASSVTVALLRVLVGTAFLGAVSDAMLLGHWYLVQPGMPRKLLNELTTAVIWTWPLEVAVLLLPTTQPESIEQFSIRLADRWKIGRKDLDDGVILVIAEQDRAVRIELHDKLRG